MYIVMLLILFLLDLEIFSSGEKANSSRDYESWLIEVAEKFNNAGFTNDLGESLSVSVRQVSSGLGADYIISGKYANICDIR